MNVAGIYLIHRFFYRLTDFFYHWYVRGSRVFLHYGISLLERLDRYFAVKITLRHFFEPLYQDYSAMGRILGFIFRPLRVIVGFAVYILVGAVWTLFYFIWLSIPITILGYVFYSA